MYTGLFIIVICLIPGIGHASGRNADRSAVAANEIVRSFKELALSPQKPTLAAYLSTFSQHKQALIKEDAITADILNSGVTDAFHTLLSHGDAIKVSEVTMVRYAFMASLAPHVNTSQEGTAGNFLRERADKLHAIVTETVHGLGFADPLTKEVVLANGEPEAESHHWRQGSQYVLDNVIEMTRKANKTGQFVKAIGGPVELIAVPNNPEASKGVYYQAISSLTDPSEIQEFVQYYLAQAPRTAQEVIFRAIQHESVKPGTKESWREALEKAIRHKHSSESAVGN